MALKGKKSEKPLQIQAFRKAARELDCDESEDRFRDVLRTIAKQKPKPTPTAPARKRS